MNSTARLRWKLAGPAALTVCILAQGPEPLMRWRYFKEVASSPAASGLCDVLLDVEALNGSRPDHADLRLYDAAQREVPFALRVRSAIDTSQSFTAREFDRGIRGGVSQASYDLGEKRLEHNGAEIHTEGNRFRRLVNIEASDDAVQWSTLVVRANLFRFAGEGGNVDEKKVAYPPSRARYLRIRLHPDPQEDEAAPEIISVSIRKTVRIQGERQIFPVRVGGREATRDQGRAASAWALDLGGRIPVEQLVLTLADPSFSRPYRLEIVDDPARPMIVTRGELARRPEFSSQPVQIEFGERFARRLKLTVADDRNAPLSILAAAAGSAARQVIFQPHPDVPAALRLHYGNLQAPAPHYDFAANLALHSPIPAARLSLGPEQPNRSYQPEHKPVSERFPWLIYLLLGLAAAALTAILIKLARTLPKTPPAQPPG